MIMDRPTGRGIIKRASYRRAVRGRFTEGKWSLYEGGIRMPFIVRWPGKVPAGQTNSKSNACGIDIFPSLCAMAGVDVPSGAKLDGVDMSRAFMGQEVPSRQGDILGISESGGYYAG